MTTDFETLLIEPQGEHVRVVSLNRPATLNALNTQMGLDLIECFEAIAMRPGALRCVVLTGVGTKAFCAGGDLKQRDGITNDEWTAQHVVFERMVRALIDCPVPLIAAVNGVAYGGGCEIAACCDFIVAADTAMFAMPEAKLGIMPGGGGTQTLARAMGERRAKELLLTGKAFSAAQAADWGLVNEVLAPDALRGHALATAELIASNAPVSTRQVKQAITRGLRMSIADGLAFEIEAYNRLVPMQDRLEGVRAFNERRKPLFKGT